MSKEELNQVANSILTDYKAKKLKWTSGAIIQEMEDSHLLNARAVHYNYIFKNDKQNHPVKAAWLKVLDTEIESRNISKGIDLVKDLPAGIFKTSNDKYAVTISVKGKRFYLGVHKYLADAKLTRAKALKYKEELSFEDACNAISKLVPDTANAEGYENTKSSKNENMTDKTETKEQSTSIIAGANVYAKTSNGDWHYGMYLQTLDNIFYVKVDGEIKEYTKVQVEEPKRIVTVTMQEIADSFGVDINQLRISF